MPSQASEKLPTARSFVQRRTVEGRDEVDELIDEILPSSGKKQNWSSLALRIRKKWFLKSLKQS